MDTKEDYLSRFPSFWSGGLTKKRKGKQEGGKNEASRFWYGRIPTRASAVGKEGEGKKGGRGRVSRK